MFLRSVGLFCQRYPITIAGLIGGVGYNVAINWYVPGSDIPLAGQTSNDAASKAAYEAAIIALSILEKGSVGLGLDMIRHYLQSIYARLSTDEATPLASPVRRV